MKENTKEGARERSEAGAEKEALTNREKELKR